MTATTTSKKPTVARFHWAHTRDGSYNRALREIRRGNKQTHWMWYVFPQLRGLAKSEIARVYGIADREEAVAYLNDPVLRVRLHECTTGVLGHDRLMFSYPDNHKLRSCMTLFREVADDPALPDKVLEKFFAGAADQNTLDLLAGKPVILTSSRPPRGVDMGKHWDKQIRAAQAAVAAAGQRDPYRDREPWSRNRVTSFVKGFGLSTVATRQLVDAWMADQQRTRRDAWEDGLEEGRQECWDNEQ